MAIRRASAALKSTAPSDVPSYPDRDGIGLFPAMRSIFGLSGGLRLAGLRFP
jgi:hypothetical protein